MRLKSTIVMILLAVYLIALAPALVGVIVMSILSYFACFELLNMLQHKSLTLSKYFLAVVAGIVPFNIFYNRSNDLASIALLMVYILITVIKSEEKTTIKQVIIIFSAVFVLPEALNSITRLYLLENGKYYVVLPVICACVTDIFAYLVGKTIGKHKLSPKISPNKTIEGAIGGVLACVIAIVFYTQYATEIFGITLISSILIGIFGAIFGILGDLFFSKLKRDAGIKDYSHIIPGHGGILDRFDSMIFTSFITYLILILA